MPLPYSFLLGVLALLGHEFLDDRLPAPVSTYTLLPWLLLLPGPWILARVLSNAVRKGRMPPQISGVLLTLSTPFVYMLLLVPGELPYLAQGWSFDSYLLESVILVAPLLLMEFSVFRAIRSRSLLHGGAAAAPLASSYHAPMVLLILVPLLLVAAGMDVVFQSRQAMLFFSWTSLGSQLGLFIFVGLLCVLLPLLFLLLMPLSEDVPEDLRETARQLGFSGEALYCMRTGGSLVNAALVGPLRWPRFLMLTDGLLMHLDPLSLRGVVAHEVGHARAGHPPLLLALFVAVPVLCLPAIELLVFEEVASESLLLLGTAVLVVAILVLRWIAHRFEYEADQLSAETLGGANACVQALERVGQISQTGSPNRSSFRHPSDARRIENLMLLELHPEYRARFHARGRVLRWLVSVVFLLAVGLSVWTQQHQWPTDHVNLLIYTGQFDEAARALAKLPPDPGPRRQQVINELREELAAGQALFPHGGDWNEIREELGARALQRGKQALVAGGAAAARGWLAMGLSQKDPAPEDLALYLYSRAMARQEGEQAQRLRQHLLERLGVGDELGRAIQAGQ